MEGIDGSGKTALAKKLYERVRRHEIEVVLTKEPTRTWLGDAVRRSVDEGLDPLVQALLFMADRSLHVERIKAWLSEGKVVLSDRYHDSTLAYQGVALQGRVPNPIEWLRRASSHLFLKPDLTLLLIVDPAEGLSRISGVRERTPFERLEFLTRVQELYMKMATEPRFVKLDASRPMDAVVAEAEEVLLSRLQ